MSWISTVQFLGGAWFLPLPTYPLKWSPQSLLSNRQCRTLFIGVNQLEQKNEHFHNILRLSMCEAFPPHFILLVWCPESHSSILGHYIALAIILQKSWSNLLSLFMELTCLFSRLIVSTSDIIFKKNVVRHEIWLSWPFYYIPPSYHLSWYAGIGCMDLTSWQIWNY